LLVKFAALSLVPLVVLGLLLATTFQDQIRARALQGAKETAQLVARLGIQPLLTPSDLSKGLGPARVEELDATLRSTLLGKEIARVRIWNLDSQVVYSDDHDLIGQRFSGNTELGEALHGEVASELSNLGKQENKADQAYGQLLEVYIPLQFAGNAAPVGAFELYLPYRPIAAAIGHDTKRLYALLALGLLVLWALLLPIAYRAGRTLRNQAVRLKVLLSREQETVRRLHELDRMKTDFVSVASHEMRTPLTTIIGVAKSLKQPGIADDAELRNELLGSMERQGDRLLGLVDELLQTARLETGSGEPHLEPFDFGMLTDEVAAMAELGSLTFKLDIPPDLPLLMSDRDVVGKILTNLVDNAVKHASAGMVCHIGARSTGTEFRFWVADQGRGMSPEQIQHIFEPFWQADTSMTRTAGGVGLGLYLVKLLASSLGGAISVESQVRAGSRFTVVLPQESTLERAVLVSVDAVA
jgi:signal transduction histidine kinase